MYETLKIDYRLVTLSTQLCAGEITREEALPELASKPYVTSRSSRTSSMSGKKLGLSALEFGEVMAAQPKKFQEYPNEKALLAFLYPAYRRLSFRRP